MLDSLLQINILQKVMQATKLVGGRMIKHKFWNPN